MTTVAGMWLGLAGLAAIGDWLAVARSARRLEWLCKPAVLLCLLAAAATLDAAEPVRQGWFVAALALSLVGDVALLAPEHRREHAGAGGGAGTSWFAAGLVAFLLGHLAYIVGFVAAGVMATWVVPAGAIGAACAIVLAQRVVWSLRASGERELIAPVLVYVAVIVVMLAVAVGSGRLTAAVGGVLFVVSDGVLAWNRFIEPLPLGRLAVHVTYHAAQAMLVVSLVW